MEEFRQQAEITFDPEAAMHALAAQVDAEANANFQDVIRQIATIFSSAIKETDKVSLRSYANDIENLEGYLGEKYRHTPEERAYLKVVRRAVEHLTALSRK